MELEELAGPCRAEIMGHHGGGQDKRLGGSILIPLRMDYVQPYF